MHSRFMQYVMSNVARKVGRGLRCRIKVSKACLRGDAGAMWED